MGLHTEDYFPGEEIEALPDDLDFGDSDDETLEDATDADEQADDSSDADDSADADAPAADDADGDADQDAGDADADQPDGEPADEAESEAESEADEPAEKPKKGVAIPKARFDQALRKQRVAEQRAQELADELAQLRQEQADASRPKPLSGDEIKAKMAEANEALIGGDTAKAAEIQAELFASMAPREQAPSEPAPERDVLAELEARMEFKTTLSDINTRFPELDDSSDSFNEELSLEAVDLQQLYMGKGFSLAEATRKAAEGVAKLFDLTDRLAVPATPKSDPKAVATKAAQSQKTQGKIAKAVKAPPPLAGRVDNSDDVAFDVYSATEEELMALPKAALDRLLGNT